MVGSIQKIVENYINNRQMAGITMGTYKGGRVVLNEKAYVPASLLTGNLKNALREGDRVRLFRGDGGKEYYLLEIIGVPMKLERGEE